MITTVLIEALQYADVQHDGQKRKALGIPYIIHPIETWTILIREGADEETQIAGILHDTVEDTDATLEDVEMRFGPRVKELVAQMTEAKKTDWSPEQKKATWKERKMSNLTRATDPAAKLIKLADRVSNSRDLVREYRKYGEAMWKSFNMSESGQQWYYTSTLEHLAEFKGREAYEELERNVAELFGIGALPRPRN